MQWLRWILLLVFLPVAAHASVEDMYYLDSSGNRQVIDGNRKYLNVSTRIGGFVRGGLDRKVGLNILDASGSRIHRVISDLIGVEDTREIDGKDRYGFEMDIALPTGEGSFTIQSVIYNSNDEVVETTEREFIIDKSPVTFGVPEHIQYRRYRALQWNVVSTYGGGPQMKVDFNWSVAPPAKAVVKATARADGSVGTKEMPVTDSGINAMLGHELFKHRESWYDMELTVWDEAGNSYSVTWEAMFDARGRPFEVVGVYDPTAPESQKIWKNKHSQLRHFVPYKPGMKVGVGRTRLLTKLKRNDHYQYNEFGNYDAGNCCTNRYFNWTRPILFEEGGYVYTLTGDAGLTGYEPENYRAQASSIGADGAVFATTVSLGVKAGVRHTLKPGLITETLFADGTVEGNDARRSANESPYMVGARGKLPAPLPYPVRVKFVQGGSTIVPAGQTHFEVGGARTTVEYPAFYVCWATGAEMCSIDFRSSISINDQPPRLKSWQYRGVSEPGVHQYRVEAWAYYVETRGAFTLSSAQIVLLDQSGSEIYRADRVKQVSSGADYTLDFEVIDVPTGTYRVKIILIDGVGNVTEKIIESRFFDADKPLIEMFNKDEPWNGEDVIRLSDLGVRVISTGSQAYIKSVAVEGGVADDKYVLAWRRDDDLFRLEYPLMFPSREPGEEYTLRVEVEDEQLNSVVHVQEFNFTPPTTVVNGGHGILIPAIEESITGGGLPPIYSEQVTFGGGDLVVGEYDVIAVLRSDADFGVNVLGYEIMPGETVIIDKYDFSAHDSKLSLPVHPVEPVVGEANLLLAPSAPGSDYILADIRTWKPNPVATINGQSFSDEISIAQAIEPVEITITGGAGDPCTYTSNQEEILASNPLFEPMCVVEWDFPDTISWDQLEYKGSGYVVGIDEDVHLGYRLYLPQGSDLFGVEVGAGEGAIHVVEPDISFAFDPDEAVIRYITEFTKSVVSTGTQECQPTVNPADARVGTKFGYPKCLIEWNLRPGGIATSHYAPIVQGIALEPDEMVFTFDVTYFDPDGRPYLLDEQTLTVPVDPPNPVKITLPPSEYDPEPDGAPRYFLGNDGQYMGTALLTASGADVEMEVTKSGELVQRLPYIHRGGRKREANYDFRIWVDELGLWEETTVAVHGAYQLMPEISDTVEATVIGVPSQQIRLTMELDGRKLLDTDEISVAAFMEGRALSNGYDPSVHGEWEIQIQYEEKRGDITSLTDWQAVDADGAISADIRLGDLADGYMYAVARLKSPYDEYSRELLSNRNYVNVLRGGAIDGNISTTRVSGRSIFTAFLRVHVEDRSYDNSLGEVEWLISEDGGQTWAPVEEGARGNYMKGDFTAGRYQIKARLHNKYTEVTSETNVQEIHVYDVPRVSIEGPQYAFKTQEVELKASTTLDWVPVPVDNYHVEWSNDDGQTWVEGSTIVASYDGETERALYQVRVRDMDAPMDQDGIFRVRMHRLNFIDPEGPRTRIYGPRRLERGDPGEYWVEMHTPRRSMEVEMAGEWVMPDGEIIPGDQPVIYDPSEEDVVNGRVELIYRSWIEGFRDQGAIDERVHRISAWQYVWPQWDVFTNTRAMEAPAELRLTPRTPGWFGWLDEERFEWTLPPGATMVHDNERRPTIRIEEPGEHLIGMTVSDARGHKSEVVKKVTLAEPDPIEAEFRYYPGNPYMRAPLEIRPRIYMRGGHRLDRIKEREILVDGQSVARGSRIQSIMLDNPGTYEITAKLYSTMGHEASATQTVTVVPNKLPLCDPQADDRFGYLIIDSNCKDEDGRIRQIYWEMAGEQLPSNSYKYRFTERQIEELGGSVTVKVRALDDAGVWSDTRTVNYTMP